MRDFTAQAETAIMASPARLGEFDVAYMASVAAIAAEYADRAERGESKYLEPQTLTAHCATLADDLMALANYVRLIYG